MFLKVRVLKYFANFTGKLLCWILFSVKLQVFRPVTLLKRDSSTGVFLWNLQNFKSTFFYRTPPVATSDIITQMQSKTEICNKKWIILATKRNWRLNLIKVSKCIRNNFQPLSLLKSVNQLINQSIFFQHNDFTIVLIYQKYSQANLI